jgi:hypothetical protein
VKPPGPRSEDGPTEDSRPGGSHGAWDQVAEARTIVEAELIALRLRQAGIEADVLDQSFRQEPIPDVRSFSVVRVLVPTDRLPAARRVLSTAEELPEGAEEAREEEA